MTAKKFFAEVAKRLTDHLKMNRPEQLTEEIVIGNFDQVLTIFTALMQRDERVQKDLDSCQEKLRLMAEEFGLTEAEMEDLADEDEGGNTSKQ